MQTVGLTGGIGSGKSTVSSMLVAKGARLVDADAITRQVQQPGSPVLAAIAARFGDDVLDEAGALLRQRLADRVFGDPEELARVIDNMVDNAVKYTPEDGSVSVAMAVRDDEVSVTVADTGLGISQADQQHVFSAFHRSTNPNALSVPGTGLGLPIAQRIAVSHGGTLSVTSELGRGSTFAFTLPLRSVRDQAG